MSIAFLEGAEYDYEASRKPRPACKNTGRKRLGTVYRFRILDHGLNDQGLAFLTQELAAGWILQHLGRNDSPYFVENEGGDLVELIYAGVRWVTKG